MIKIFTTSIFAPIQYFAHLASVSQAKVEVFCNYNKKTYRNRYVIAGANGTMALSVPVVNNSGEKTLTKDIRVSYDTPWNEIHWKSIEAAYNSSPYFLYYKDDIEPLFRKKWNFLIDLNMASTQIALELTGVDTILSLTNEYLNNYPIGEDYRETIHPKKDFLSDENFIIEPYRQLFVERHNFIANLSILDLIFNKGPESLIVLESSIVR